MVSFLPAATNNPTLWSKVGDVPVTFNSITGRLQGLTTAVGTHAIILKATNAQGTGQQEFTLTINPVTDIDPPATPTGLVASNITSTSLTLTWDLPIDASYVKGVDIFKNGSYHNAYSYTPTPGPVPTYWTVAPNVPLVPGSTNTWKVRFKDAFDNLSEFSNEIEVTQLP